MQLREGSCKPGTNCYFLCAAWSKKKTSSVASEASVTKDVMGVLYLSIDVKTHAQPVPTRTKPSSHFTSDQRGRGVLEDNDVRGHEQPGHRWEEAGLARHARGVTHLPRVAWRQLEGGRSVGRADRWIWGWQHLSPVTMIRF